MTLTIGRTESNKPFTLPTDAATQTISLLGRKGSGKTNTSTVIVEELLGAGVRVVVLDPMGIWYGLRSSADGKRDGFPIAVLGGEHGDIPLEAHGGRHVAEFIVRENMSAVIDVSEFGENDKRRFVADFAETFYRQNRTAMMLVVEEADEFAPQSNLAGKDAARCLGAMQNIVRRGRSRGIGCTLITQRSAAIAKDVLTQTECLFAMQTTAPHDLKAIEAWLAYHVDKATATAAISDLPKFQRGEAWVSSPGWLGNLIRVQVRKRSTFDSSATPKPGEAKAQPKTLAEVDLSKLAAGMKDAVETAKANDPRFLKAEVERLKRQLAAKAPAAPTDSDAVKKAVDRAVEAAKLEFVKAQRRREAQLHSAITTLQRRMTKARESLDLNGFELPEDLKADEALATIVRDVAATAGVPRSQQVVASVNRGGGRRETLAVPGEATGLNDYQRSLLAVLLDRSPVPTSRSQIATLAGKSIKSSAFNPNLNALVNNGYATHTHKGYLATEQAVFEMGDYKPAPQAGDAAVQHWLRKLPAYETRLFRSFTESAGSHTKQSLAESAQCSLTSSAFSPALRNLVDLGLVVESDGEYSLADHLR